MVPTGDLEATAGSPTLRPGRADRKVAAWDVDASPSGSIVWQDQQPRHGARPANRVRGHFPAKPTLSVEAHQHCLEVRDHRLDLDDQERTRRRMKAEDVDRPTFAADVERGLWQRPPSRSP